jgi:7-cyano-7-deazaguanine synthase
MKTPNAPDAVAKKAIVLLSGGLDSSTALAIAQEQGFSCYALTVLYGQQHDCEIQAAKNVAATLGAAEHRILDLDLRALAVSALTSDKIEVPKDRPLAEISQENDVPSTYVPARNTIFLSFALAWAETLGANDIFIGVNVLDASGYPDCRPAFVNAFERLANVATHAGVSGSNITIHVPLIKDTKAGIIQKGLRLGVDYSITHSCYDPKDTLACGHCDACILRRKGFIDARVDDPTRYAN